MAFGVHMHLLAEQKKTEEFQKNTEQSKAETDGGLRDDAATSIQACLAKAIIIATAETDEERKQFANPVFETTFAEYLDPYNSIINDPLVKWGGRVGG